MKKLLTAGVVCLLGYAATTLLAADRTWIEVKTPHFTVATDDTERRARDIAWQFEQVRATVRTVFPWAKNEIAEPIVILGPRDEDAMKELLPQYADRWNGARYSSVTSSAPDRHYIAIRTDVLGENDQNVNPYRPVFWTYAALAISQSLGSDLPQWYFRGMAEFVSNTIVTNSSVEIGRPIPSNLQRLASSQRPRLNELFAADRNSPWITDTIGRLPAFDATAWAFIHFLMFGEQGVHRPRLDQFTGAVFNGVPPQQATAVAFKDLEKVEYAFAQYLSRSIYSFGQIKIDANVKREAFATRKWSPAESNAWRALFYTANERPKEARMRIDEARKLEPNLPMIYEAEGRLAEDEKRPDDARVAYGKAVELGSTSFYAHYRFGSLTYRPGADAASLAAAEKAFDKSTSLNPDFAWSHALLGELRMQLGRPAEAITPLNRAAVLEQSTIRFRVSLARALMLSNRREEAQKIAEAALSLSKTDAERRSAQQVLDMLNRPTPPSR